ncbi:alpha/beta hydrolase [Roseivirga sp. E12]|uniref:alpha/beta hydrolase n=1 Tax=Roseivirga sp. E12 TaxID=2819237 RepID=UPI001ABD31A1|nr:alpha/beta hydrolase [Roseivirga sp. E12]MBO3698682.1 alpha/beta hydrolase [Roseivirga sp. E12]
MTGAIKKYLCIALIFSSLSNCTQAQHNKVKSIGDITIKEKSFKNVYDQKIDGESGWLAVPENRNKNNNSIVKLPFFRFKSYSENPGSPVIYLSGGPGDSGIEEGKGQLFWLLEGIRSHSDVILFDQRGTGGAIPSLSMSASFELPLDKELDSEASDKALKKTVAQMAEFLQRNQIDPSAYNTLENAADVKDLIKGLGYEKVNILSHSYGTHLALSVMKYHTEIVDKAVLVGINGLDQRWRSPLNFTQQVKVIQSFIDSDPKLSKVFPQFEENVSRVLKRLEKEPVKVSVEVNGKQEEVLVGRYELELIHLLSMSSTSNVRNIALTYQVAAEGHFEGIAEVLVETLKRRQVGTIMTYLTSSASGVSQKRRGKINTDLNATGHTDAMNYPFNRIDFQSALGSTPLPDEFREDFYSNIPTLMVSGELDPRTSVEDANQVEQQLTNSRHFIVPLTSHDVLFFPPKSISAISSFFSTGTFPQAIERGGRFSLRISDTPVHTEKVLEIIKSQGIQVGIDIIKRSHAGNDFIVDPLLINGIGTSILREDRYEEAYKIFQLGIEMFPNVWYLHGNAAIGLSRIGSKGISLRKKETGRMATAYEHYMEAKRLNPYYFSEELEKLKK